MNQIQDNGLLLLFVSLSESMREVSASDRDVISVQCSSICRENTLGTGTSSFHRFKRGWPGAVGITSKFYGTFV